MAGQETIYDTLTRDHRKVSELLEQLCRTEDNQADRRRELFNELKAELVGHTQAEAGVMYSRLEDHRESRMQALEGEEEHHLVDVLLGELERDRKDNDRWLAKVQVLKEVVEHHVREEEQELFEMARHVFSDEEARDLGRRFTEQKEQRILQMQGGNFPG